MEIRENGFIPTRLSRVTIMLINFVEVNIYFINGNAIDKVYKHRNQVL